MRSICLFTEGERMYKACNLCDMKNACLMSTTNSEAVNHPVHYQGKNECIDVMEAMFGRQAVIDFCKCNAFKYRFRAGMKNGEEDIHKAEWYETKLIELMEAEKYEETI